MAKAALIATLALSLAACAFTLATTPRSIKDAEKAVKSNGGTVADAHSVEVHRLLGLTFGGSVTYIAGEPTSIKSVSSGPAPQPATSLFEPLPTLRITMIDQASCGLESPATNALLNEVKKLYNSDRARVLPADVELRFVPIGQLVKREHLSLRLGETASLEFWFPCDRSLSDDYRFDAILTLVHELTHATVQYFGASTAEDEGLYAEYVANGAPACLSVALQNRPENDPGRQVIERLKRFERDPMMSEYSPEIDLPNECEAWHERMSRLH